MAWNGSAWTNAELRKWNGSSWVTADAYFWDGSQWVLCTDRTPPTSTYVKQYTNVWRRSFADNGASVRNDTNGNNRNYQGSAGDGWGIQCSLWGFASTIHTEISGAVAYYYAQIFMDNNHAWYNPAGMTASMAISNAQSAPSTFQAFAYGLSVGFSYGEAKWVNLGTTYCRFADDGFGDVNQIMYALGIYRFSTDPTYYGYFSTSATYEHSYEK